MKNALDIPMLLLPLVLPIMLGYLFRKIKVFREPESDILRKFVVNVSVPFLIFKSLYKANMESLAQLFPMAVGYFILTVLYTLVSYLLAPMVSKEYKQQNAFAFTTVMGNYAFLGWGVIFLFYGDAGLTRAVFFTMMFWPTFLLCGFWLVNRRSRGTQRAKGPLLPLILKNASVPFLTVLFSIAMNLFKVPVPEVAWDFVQQFAAFTIPMILFIIGLNFKIRMPVTSLKILTISALVRLIGGFGIGLIVAFTVNLLLPIDFLSRKVILLQAIMPAATMSVFFAQHIDLDRQLQSGIIAYTTLFSLLTIPPWYFIVERFFH